MIEIKKDAISKKELINLYLKKKLSTWEIEKRYGYSRSTVYMKLKEYDIKIRSRAESHIIYPMKSFSGNLKEKAYLIGFMLGDLRVRKQYMNSESIRADCGSTKIEQIELIKELFSPYGHVWVDKPNNGKTQIEVGLNQSFNFLLNKDVPEWILASRKYFIPFLAGFTDAEGSFGVYDNKARYQLGNYNHKLLFLIHNKLNEFMIDCNKPHRNHKKYVSKEGYKCKEYYWNISINRKDSLLKLINSLEPYIKHGKKTNDMIIAKNNIIKRNLKYGGLNEKK